jgi:YihY family inner membrane protein
LTRYIAAFYRKALSDNVTGLSGMVAFNLLLSVFPVALVALFVAGRLLRSQELESRVLNDLQQLFPSATEGALTRSLDRVRDSSASIGVVAVIASIWIGASFWGALDTAFCRIYHVRCRSWLEQKRFALAMVVVVLLLMAATVAVPALQSLLASGKRDLPFGLSDVRPLIYALGLIAGLALLFAILCLIYWTVPNRLVPWRAIWPGASAATVAIAAVDYAFPAYLGHISTIARVGTTFVFVLIVLIWFYALALIILGGAIANAMRFEQHDSEAVPAAAE